MISQADIDWCAKRTENRTRRMASFFGESGRQSDQSESSTAEATDLGRMAALVNSNERLFRDLRRVRGRLDQAMDYWKAPGANRDLAQARLVQLRAQHKAILTELRVNREEAIALLARHGDLLPD